MANNKIAFVVPYRFVPPINGGHKAAYGLSKFLHQIHPLKVYSTTDNQKDEASFVSELLLPSGVSKYVHPLVAWRLYSAFKKDNIQLCITHQPFIALLLLPVCLLLGIPLHIYAQNLEYHRFRTMGKSWWPIVFLVEWITFKLANHIYFISPDEVEPAQKTFALNPQKCSVLPYGTPYDSPPDNKHTVRQQIRQLHNYANDECLIIFFGPQTYQPNLEAVELIIQQINPLLQQKAHFPYRFIICGGGLPKKLNKLDAFDNVEYLGFVKDIEAYVKASDMMINPVNSGGGVKTKLIESIALGKTVISSQTGALGVLPEACGNQLIIVDDFDYSAYCKAIIQVFEGEKQNTPSSFYEEYYWGKIVENVIV